MPRKFTIKDLSKSAKQYDRQLEERFDKIDKELKELKQKIKKYEEGKI